MLEFIKMFGLGVLYTLLFPFIVVIFALFFVYVLGNYLVLEAINVCGFFFGYTFTTETELDDRLQQLKDEGGSSSPSDSKDLELEFEFDFPSNDMDMMGRDNDE